VEDVPSGIRAGKAAGARVIALRTTLREVELKNAGADWVLNNCADIVVTADAMDLLVSLADRLPSTAPTTV